MNRLIAILSLMILTSCTLTQQDKQNLEAMSEEMPKQEAFDITFIYSDSGVIQTRLTAPHVIEHQEENEKFSEFDRGLKLEFFGPEGERESELTANEGTLNMQKGIAQARGNVVVINEKGDRLESEKLYWNKETDKIYTNEFVKIRTKDEIVMGDSLEADTKFSEYKIFKIRGIISLEDE